MRLAVIGDHLVGINGQGLRSWHVETQELVAEHPLKNTWFDDQDFDVGGACGQAHQGQLMLGWSNNQYPSSAIIVDPQLRQIQTITTQLRLELWNIDWSPDRTLGAGHIWGEGVAIWEISTGKTLREFEGHISSGVRFSPDGHLVAAGDSGQGGGVLYTLDLREEDDAAARTNFPPPQAGQPLYDASIQSAFSLDGSLLAFTTVAWGVRGVVIYEVATQRELWSVQYEMDDPEVELWQAQQPTFLPDQRTLLVGIEQTLRAFDVQTGQPRTPIEGFDAQTPPYYAVDPTRRTVWSAHQNTPTPHPWPQDW